MTETKTITPTQDVKNNLSHMKRGKGESTASFANRLYSMQMEIYSAWAGTDLWIPFEDLSTKVQQGWLERAKNQK